MVVGNINILDGVFYVKRFKSHNISKLTIDDEIYEKDVVFGCIGNRETNCVFINFNTGIEAILFGNEEYVINENLYISRELV